MNRFDYLKLALKAELYKSKVWVITAFALIQENPEAYRKDPYFCRLIQMPTGTFFVGEGGQDDLVKIDDATPGQPLFSFQDKIEVTPEMCPSTNETIQSTVGQLLFNLICLMSSFGKKFPYVNGQTKVSAIEERIAAILHDTPDGEENRSTEYLYVDEYVKFVDALTFMTGFNQLCVWAATPKTLVTAPGFKEFKAQLVEKYGIENLKDPVKLSAFEKELQAFDDQFLKDDPSFGIFMSGKIRDVSRKRMFLTMGAADGFFESPEVHPVVNSLEEGWPKDPESVASLMNSSRAGSFSRGAETVKGGVSAKTLLRSAGNFKIIDTDCETQLGIRRLFDKSETDRLIGRYVQTKTGWSLVETKEAAAAFADVPVVVRSPMFCKLDEDNICRYCAGEKLAQNPTGISTAMTEVSSIIMTSLLKKMHGSALSTRKMDYTKVLS